jgi:uncharacterized protein (DUF2267 family)
MCGLISFVKRGIEEHIMSHTTVSTFTQAAQQAQQWINELAADLNWSEQRSFRIFRAVLHTMRDWLSQEEMSDLSAQLPVLIRGVYFEGWDPLQAPVPDRKKRDFVLSVSAEFGHENDVDLERAIRAVFHLLDRHVSHGEMVQVRNSMQKALRQLWPTN